MEADGLILARTEIVGKKLEKKFYQITTAGRQILTEWMDEPLGPLVPTRDEFTMKLYLIDSAADPRIPQLFQEEIARHEKNTNISKPDGHCFLQIRTPSSITDIAVSSSKPFCGKSSV